ncbi:imidazolonepropionase [Nakamurella sp. YIM 132087]|uniref:Imidazolonepropionase n=1 Tax=Nakamurella alba TaxID=2665158 RepID=A0A7K1FG10_9ACTN|nr:imidazolonepropionase [Nakamurella alba]MTD13006.1 imidazolonepropionase [Nakamurella alba]
MTVLVQGISQLVTNDPALGEGPLGVVRDAALVLDGERVLWAGTAASASDVGADERVDVGGRAVLPGWVDSHTHLVFDGDRAAEFTARMAGEAYEAGGIMTTVHATREASDEQLTGLVQARLAEMLRGGTTTVETKTGYGLSFVDEVRSARIADATCDVTTFLGAHLVPADFAGDIDGYLDLVCGQMLDGVLAALSGPPGGYFIDVFCEDGAFDEARSRRVLAAGQRVGLGLKVHGNQLGYGPGVRLAVDAGATSVDHCTYLTDEDIDLLAGSSTVATLLPTCDLSTRQPAAPGRRLADAGATIALASNCNPGTSYTSSMNLVVALGVLQCGLTADEAVRAATAGGAAALGLTDVGVLRPGAFADLHVLDAPSHDHLAYRVGMPLTHAVWRRGKQVA